MIRRWLEVRALRLSKRLVASVLKGDHSAGYLESVDDARRAIGFVLNIYHKRSKIK